MTRSGRPPRFKPVTAPLVPALAIRRNFGVRRTSPRLRGLDAKWDRLSIAFRKRHPTCKFCLQLGRDSLAAVTDHIIPSADRPDLRYEWRNLQALCANCHDVTKQQLEAAAREIGVLDILVQWSTDPWSRPPSLRPIGGKRG